MDYFVHQDQILLQPYLQVHHHLQTKKKEFDNWNCSIALYQENAKKFSGKYIVRRVGRKCQGTENFYWKKKVRIYTAYKNIHENLSSFMCTSSVDTQQLHQKLLKKNQTSKSLGFWFLCKHFIHYDNSITSLLQIFHPTLSAEWGTLKCQSLTRCYPEIL